MGIYAAAVLRGKLYSRQVLIIPPNYSSVCFSGFRTADEPFLHALAEAAWMQVVTAVDPSLYVLCIGENPDPIQLAHAHQLGVRVMTLAEFFNHLVDAGKLPK